jgi:hypothetical protein
MRATLIAALMSTVVARAQVPAKRLAGRRRDAARRLNDLRSAHLHDRESSR